MALLQSVKNKIGWPKSRLWSPTEFVKLPKHYKLGIIGGPPNTNSRDFFLIHIEIVNNFLGTRCSENGKIVRQFHLQNVIFLHGYNKGKLKIYFEIFYTLCRKTYLCIINYSVLFLGHYEMLIFFSPKCGPRCQHNIFKQNKSFVPYFWLTL